MAIIIGLRGFNIIKVIKREFNIADIRGAIISANKDTSSYNYNISH